jgi:hypothetical protein
MPRPIHLLVEKIVARIKAMEGEGIAPHLSHRQF